MADHEHGSMDIETQEKTFEGFMSFVTKTTIIILAILVILAVFFR
ncbi:MAG: aa3-type cytochrome c oxidase subunit IV [Sulfitobacter sp.]|nr:aa3-type cytochrome c oxidase subunit IV [Sulfitobacter sp.]